MPQTFRALRCFSCEAFQVHQETKSNKWTCKLCHEKQSIIKVFATGSGAEMRHTVQELNAARGAVEQQRQMLLQDS